MTKQAKELDWIKIGKRIAAKLRRRFDWIEDDELLGVALLAAVQANEKYVVKHKGWIRQAWIYTKGGYLAYDALRARHGVRRVGAPARPKVKQGSALGWDSIDNEPCTFAEHECVGVEQECYVSTSCREWLGGLSEMEKRVMILYFDEDMTYTEIGEMFDRTDSWTGIIIRAALAKLRRTRKGAFEAGERSRTWLA